MNHGRTVFRPNRGAGAAKAFDLACAVTMGSSRPDVVLLDQLLCMIFAQLTARASLRETVVACGPWVPARYRCGIRGPVAKSTPADANEQRDYRIFQDVALAMINAARIEFPVDSDLTSLEAEVFCPGFDDHRSVPEAVSLGGVSPQEGGRQVPMSCSTSCGKSRIHAGFARQDARSVDARPDPPRGRGVLRHGSRLCRFSRLCRLHTAGAFFVTRANAGWISALGTHPWCPHRDRSSPTIWCGFAGLCRARFIPTRCGGCVMSIRKVAGG